MDGYAGGRSKLTSSIVLYKKRTDGTRLYVESKKGKANKSSQEYPLMREAIDQLMTSGVLTEDIL